MASHDAFLAQLLLASRLYPPHSQVLSLSQSRIHMNKFLLVASLAGLAASAHAQTGTVVPAKYTTVEASSYTSYPFGLGSACRLQYLYDASLVGPTVVAMKEIAFRGNGGLANTGKTGVELEIKVSTTKTNPWAASSTFASNHGTNVSTVFTKKKINLPAQPVKTPNDFVTVFKLDKSFVYIRATGNLLIDYVVTGQPSGAYAHDTSFTSSAVNTVVGTACGGTNSSVTGGQKLNATSTVSYNLTGAPANGVAIHLLGSAPLKTPVALPLGGCKLYQNILLAIGVATNATGGATMIYPLPTNARDLSIHGQFVAFDSKLTKLVATQSNKTVLGGLDPHTRIYSTSSATNATGSIQLGVGIVTRLR
jgi:hypothetical protein